MDRSINRNLVYDHVYIDSAFRRDRDTSFDYNVYFESNTGDSARRLKDVVSLDIVTANLPVRNDNILPGINSFDIHLLKDESTDFVLIENIDELQHFMRDININTSHVINTIKISSEPDIFDTYAIFTLTSFTSVVLCQTTPFGIFDTEWHTEHQLYTVHISPELKQVSSPLMLQEGTRNFVSPLNFKLFNDHSIPVSLQPGYYPSFTSMINQLLVSFQYVDPPEYEQNLSYTDMYNSDQNLGWSTRRIPQTNWSLYFKTNRASTQYSHIALTKRYHQHEFDLLSQLGLQYETTGENWDEQPKKHEKRHTFFMKLFDVDKDTEEENTIVPESRETERINEEMNLDTTERIFELRFEPMNLIPRRYVNVIVEQIPRAGCKMTNDNVANVICRIDLTSSHFTQYSDAMNRDASTSASYIQEGTHYNAFTTYKCTEIQKNNTFFEPITIKGINVKLKDNLGIDYDTATCHTIELRITRLGDATAVFDIPQHNVSSVTQHNRRLLQPMDDYPEYRKQRIRKKHKTSKIEIYTPNGEDTPTLYPIYRWTDENKWAILGTATTFFGTLYLTSYFRPRTPSSQSMSNNTSSPYTQVRS